MLHLRIQGSTLKEEVLVKEVFHNSSHSVNSFPECIWWHGAEVSQDYYLNYVNSFVSSVICGHSCMKGLCYMSGLTVKRTWKWNGMELNGM